MSKCDSCTCSRNVPAARIPDHDQIPFIDVAVIGAGVIGCSIARELSKLNLKIAVFEKEDDVAAGASKANSGIVHGGYDETNGTVKSRLTHSGNRLFSVLNADLNFGFKVTGSLVLALTPSELPHLQELLANGRKNGVPDLRIIYRDEILRMEPHVNPEVYAALHCPHTGITSPYEYTIALAENAIQNGVQIHLSSEIIELERIASTTTPPRNFHLRTKNSLEFQSTYVINAAGLHAAHVTSLLTPPNFYIKPRKGEYILLDKSQGSLVNCVLFPVPSKERGKGILVSRTFHGNLLLGPTSRDVEEDVRSKEEVLKEIIGKARVSVPGFDVAKAITSYAGFRAKSSVGDFIIRESPTCQNLILAAGIDSPGLTASPAVALMVSKIVSEIHGRTSPTPIPFNPNFNPRRARIIVPKSDNFKGTVDHTSPSLNVICRCERVTEAEIIDAIHRPLGAHSTDAVKKRTRAGMGECQGGFCEARVVKVLARELNIAEGEVKRRGVGSSVLPHRRVSREDGEYLKGLVGKGESNESKL